MLYIHIYICIYNNMYTSHDYMNYIRSLLYARPV